MQGEDLWQELYGPERKTASALSTFISENVTMIKNLAEYVAPGEVGSFDEIEPGRGAIVRQGLKKVAAYRDEAGAIHAFSAACTHLGCHLHWNSFEQCWDCPCHGSQFSIDGAVLNAPAIHPLQEVEVDSSTRSAASFQKPVEVAALAAQPARAILRVGLMLAGCCCAKEFPYGQWTSKPLPSGLSCFTIWANIVGT